MKANELMVGDWVMFPNFIEKVQEVAYVEGKGYCASFAASATLFPIPIDKLKPIPLTDEILDKNFERKEHGWQVKDCWKIWANPNYGYILATLVMDEFGGGSYEPCIPCTYLHELQNAMTVLRAGKEIKP